MMKKIRRQLTLFADKADALEIEHIRSEYNPIQKALIDCHITLCREDEITHLDKVLVNLSALKFHQLICQLGKPKLFEDEKGIFIPVYDSESQFHELRTRILKNGIEAPRIQNPHITLLHPRNSVCSQDIFVDIVKRQLPAQLTFKTISLIEQKNDEKWKILRTFKLLN